MAYNLVQKQNALVVNLVFSHSVQMVSKNYLLTTNSIFKTQQTINEWWHRIKIRAYQLCAPLPHYMLQWGRWGL